MLLKRNPFCGGHFDSSHELIGSFYLMITRSYLQMFLYLYMLQKQWYVKDLMLVGQITVELAFVLGKRFFCVLLRNPYQ